MEPKIIERDEIILAGMDFYGDPFTKAKGWSEQNEIGRLWQRFMRYYDKNEDKIKNMVSEADYEVWVGSIEKLDEKDKYIFVGVEVEKIQDLPLQLVAKILPRTQYAVFTIKGKEIKSDWSSKIYKEWLPESGYKEAYSFLIEYYDHERFKGMDNEESEIDIYLPIKK
ncbi:GyrI-like domain-containing protein [candidate division WOR-3 bacterium]|nr:GyrI-like domain-containing protein [candidate division WOR-3 bacterium]